MLGSLAESLTTRHHTFRPQDAPPSAFSVEGCKLARGGHHFWLFLLYSHAFCNVLLRFVHRGMMGCDCEFEFGLDQPEL
jgi:hypothetical protein